MQLSSTTNRVTLDGKYLNDIENIRRRLKSGEINRIQQHFFVVDLFLGGSFGDGDRLAFILDSFSLYIVGFKNAQAGFYFKDISARLEGVSRKLEFTGDYGQLGFTNSHFSEKPIDLPRLVSAYQNLGNAGTETVFGLSHKHDLILMIIALSEAIRFDEVCCLINNVICFPEFASQNEKICSPGFLKNSYLNNWAKESKQGGYTEIPSIPIVRK